MAIVERLTTIMSTKGQVDSAQGDPPAAGRWDVGQFSRLTVEDTAEGVLLKAAPLFAPDAGRHKTSMECLLLCRAAEDARGYGRWDRRGGEAGCFMLDHD